MEVRFLGMPEREDWQGVDWDSDPDWEFRTATGHADLIREAIDGAVGE